MTSRSADNPNIPESIIKSFFNEGVVAFVGSGPSIDAGLVSWSGLLELMAKEAKQDMTTIEFASVSRHISDRKYLIVADFLRAKMTENQFVELLEDHFLKKTPSILHQTIVSLPFRGIITTNYDLLLSEADGSRMFDHPFAWQDLAIPRKISTPFILHAHGMANNSETIVLSTSDYDRIRLDQRADKFWRIIQNIFSTYRILFIGYSLSDLDFELFLAELRYIFRGQMRDQFILITHKEDDMDPVRIHELRRNGLRPIYISDDPTISKAMLNWLNKLKKKIEERDEIVPVIETSNDNDRREAISYQITPLLGSLTNYLCTKYSTTDNANNLLEILNENERFFPNNPIDDCWKKYVENSYVNKSREGFRDAVITLLKQDPNERLLKRILSHLLPE